MKKIKPSLLLLFIIVVGILLRITYLTEIQRSPFFSTPFGDAQVFDAWAVTIAEGNIVGTEVFFKAPLYPYMLGFLYKCVGHHMLFPRLLNLLFDAISILFLFLIGKKIWGSTAGIIAAVIGAFSGPLIYFSGEILGTSLSVLLSLAALYSMLTAGLKWGRWFCVGVVLALLILVRPNALLCVPAILVYLYVIKISLRFKVILSLVFLCGVFVLLLSTGVRNYMVGKDFVLVNYSGGVNFYIGNNPESDGISAVLPGYGNDWDEYSIAEMRMSRELKPSEVSRYWTGQGLDFVRNHTGQFIRLFIKKCFLLWNGKEISNNQNIYRFVRQSLLLRSLLFFYGSSTWYFAFPSSLILSLAISGIILNYKRKTAVLLPLLCVLAFGFSVALFFVASRYRMVFIAFLIPFSAASVFWLISHLRRKRDIFLWIFSFIPFLIITNIDPYSVSMGNNALESYNFGNAYLQQGKLDKAKECYRRGIKADDHFPRLHLNLGTIYFKENNLKQAEEEYLIEISINPQDARAYHNLSLVCERKGQIEDAIAYERKAVEKMVRYTLALCNLGRLYVKVEQYDSALVFLQKAHRLEKKDGKILSLLGLSNLKLGYYEEAISIYEKAVQLNDEEPFIHYNLAIAFIAAENLSEARMHLLRAVIIKGDFAEAHYNLGLVYLREGKTDKATDHLREAIRIQPNLQEAKKMIENMK